MFKAITKSLSLTVFILSMVIIFILGLAFCLGLYYFTNPPQIPAILQGPVTTLPVSLKLDLSSPDDNKLVFDSGLLIQGQSSPNSLIILSSETTDELVETGSQGNFSFTVKLSLGVNQFSVAAFDSLGNSKIEKRTVYYSKEKI